MSLYSTDKIAKHPERIEQMRKGIVPPPLQVLISPSDTCNHKCRFCTFRDPASPVSEQFLRSDGSPPVRILPYRVCRELIRDCSAIGVKAIQITGGGEPMLHPDFPQICESVSEWKMALGIVTNGTLYERWMTHYVKRAAWVRVSVNAGTEKTYREIHRCGEGQWDKAWDTVQAFAEMEGPEVGVSMVVTPGNVFEVAKFLLQALRSDANNVRLTCDVNHPLPPGTVAELNDLAKDFPIPIHLALGPRLQKSRNTTCLYQFLAPYVGADYGVYRCCNTAYTSLGFLGDLAIKSFSDIWRGRDREGLHGFDARQCSSCAHVEKNAILRGLVQSPSAHDLFV